MKKQATCELRNSKHLALFQSLLCEIENSLEYTCYTCGYFITLYQDDVMSDSSVQDPSLTNHIQNEVGLDRGSALSKFTCTNSLHEFHANL